MGIFDRFKNQARDKAKSKDMSDAAERRVNERTGGKYEDQVDAAQQRAEGALGMDRDRDRPDQP
ncbi:antitoxin [Streptomyces sp. NPDC048751]|uniref:antitoxin n=1 Tax=Streptomyces sp. NPDC048751 TaxID=3365591 RepID=UPI003722E9A9